MREFFTILRRFFNTNLRVEISLLLMVKITLIVLAGIFIFGKSRRVYVDADVMRNVITTTGESLSSLSRN